MPFQLDEPSDATGTHRGFAAWSGGAYSVLLIAWALANYGATCWGGFSNDDFIWIAGAWPATRSSWLQAAFHPHPWWSHQFVRPLVQLSFFCNYRIGAFHPWGYHAVNVALHVINTLLVWGLASQVLKRRGLALVAAMMFCVQPYHSWTVAWVSGRTQLLCATALLLGLRWHARGRTAGAALSFALALSANEAAICFPFVAVAYDRLVGAPPRRRLWLAWYGAIIVIYLAGRFLLTQQFAHGVLGLDVTQPAESATLAAFLRAKVTLIGQYLLAPLPVRGFRRSTILLLGLAVLAALAGRSRSISGRAVLFGLAWVVLSLAPFVAWYQFQPWYVYVPSIGICLVVTGLAQRIFELRQRWWLRAGCGGVLAVWLGASVAELWSLNVAQQRAGLASLEVTDALQRVMPAPASGTRFCLAGLDAMRLGAEPGVPQPIFVFGLDEALRLAFRDPTLGLAFADGEGRCPIPPERDAQPTFTFRWDSPMKRFIRETVDFR